jgi:DNA polymerase III alpha subunit
MAQAFIRRYRGEEPVSLLHPALGRILGPTQGVLLFQEQVLRVAREIAGLSWAQADQLRRGMSKMRAQAMAALQEEFVAGCQRAAPAGPAMSAQQAQRLWEQVLAFSGYGFNQGHATAYADVSYHSGRRFTLSYENGSPTLWMGLGQVRSLRRASAAAIQAGAPFEDLRHLLSSVSLQEKEIRNLIQCGALDGMAESRAALLALMESLLRAASARQMAFDFATAQEVEAESAQERLAWETHILGQPVSVHPAQLIAARAGLTALSDVADTPGRCVRVAGGRLPGRTGGATFLLGDGHALVPVRLNRDRLPSPWQPVLLQGAWQRDRWGGGWFQAVRVRELSLEG